LEKIDNIDPIQSFFTDKELQRKVFSFLKKNNYKIINENNYLDKSFDINITNGIPLPQIKNVGILGNIKIKDVKSIQENRSFKKLQKQIKRVIKKKHAPLTIDKEGYIINGHHRYDALRILKKKKTLVRMLNIHAKDLSKLEISAEEFKKLLKFHSFNSYKISSIQLLEDTEAALIKKIT
jgi:hypothetical protein